MAIILNLWPVAIVFQPEMPGLFFDVLSHGKVWIVIVLGPVLALLPDLFVDCIRKVFAVSPVIKALIAAKKSNLRAIRLNSDIRSIR